VKLPVIWAGSFTLPTAKGQTMRLLAILLSILCLLAAAAAVVVWSGAYNVAANVPHWNVTHWCLEQVRERSISAHSKGIVVPPLADSKLINAGFQHYHAMCRLCHNAPGYPRTEVSRGLYPAPPDFTAKETTPPGDAEIFWTVRNGVKMTGMPSFGATHGEKDLWAIVLFVKRLPNFKPEQYDVMVKAAGPRKGEEHHH
jgi:mono/diheme cytochrome c family protein